MSKSTLKKMVDGFVAALTLISTGSLAATGIVSANEIQETQAKVGQVNGSTSTNFDREALGASATFDPKTIPAEGLTKVVKNAKGDLVNFSITPLKNPFTKEYNGEYIINAWSVNYNVTYYISVYNNTITNAYSLDYWIAVYSASSYSLTVDNWKQATARFYFTTPIYDLISWTGWVRATINSSDRIVVSTN